MNSSAYLFSAPQFSAHVYTTSVPQSMLSPRLSTLRWFRSCGIIWNSNTLLAPHEQLGISFSSGIFSPDTQIGPSPPLQYLIICSGSAVIRSLNVRKILSSLVSCFAIASNVSSSNASLVVLVTLLSSCFSSFFDASTAPFSPSGSTLLSAGNSGSSGSIRISYSGKRNSLWSGSASSVASASPPLPQERRCPRRQSNAWCSGPQ